jgi:hypothetical protein
VGVPVEAGGGEEETTGAVGKGQIPGAQAVIDARRTSERMYRRGFMGPA